MQVSDVMLAVEEFEILERDRIVEKKDIGPTTRIYKIREI